MRLAPARSVCRRKPRRRTFVRLPERRCDPLLASSAGEGGREGALRVSFVGSGNWGSAAAWIAAQNCLRHDTFNDTIRMFALHAAEKSLEIGVRMVDPPPRVLMRPSVRSSSGSRR